MSLKWKKILLYRDISGLLPVYYACKLAALSFNIFHCSFSASGWKSLERYVAVACIFLRRMAPPGALFIHRNNPGYSLWRFRLHHRGLYSPPHSIPGITHFFLPGCCSAYLYPVFHLRLPPRKTILVMNTLSAVALTVMLIAICFEPFHCTLKHDHHCILLLPTRLL